MLLSIAPLLPEMVKGAEPLQKIRVGLPSLALTYMPFYTAQEKGLLKKVGLEAEYIQMNTGIQPQAVIGGNINFFPSLSTGISAAVSGVPLVIVLNFYDITPWMLVTSKDINKPRI
jgi:ABC-type nitrate/sulfonate/bicarbonate transport system substrate-binding protein